MEEARLQYLLQRHLDGTLTEAELREWERWVDEEAAASETTVITPDETRDALFRKVVAIDRPAEVPISGRRIGWRLPAVAAAFVLACAGIYLFRPAPAPRPAITRTSDAPMIIPGGDKALLTLADGRQITLDTASNGELGQQGGVRVVKLQTGLLSYAHTAEGKAAGGMGAAGGIGAGTAGTNLASEANSAAAASIANGGGYNVLATPRGGQYQVILPDGTQVWLNSSSILKYPVAFAGTREVELTGEAYFDVRKDHSTPFVVHTAHSHIDVLGTAFDVMAYPNEPATRTTLIAGSVKVRVPALSGSGRADGESRVIQPGEQAAVDNRSQALALTTPDLEEVTAWKNGRFQFNNTNLPAIMRQIERWYDVQVVYKGNFDSVGFTGRVSRKQYASQLLELLAMDGRVHFDIEGRHIIVNKGSK